MKNSSDIPAKVQIRNLLIVIGSGVIFAMAIAAFMLGAYNPSGRYKAQNVLLAPETAKVRAEFRGDKELEFYEGVEFDYVKYANFDRESKLRNKPLYQKFYALVKDDESIQELPVKVQELFDRNPATLTFYVLKPGKISAWQIHNFQVLQFANGGDYYRVELHTGAKEGQQWAYFHHVGLADKFLRFLQPGKLK